MRMKPLVAHLLLLFIWLLFGCTVAGQSVTPSPEPESTAATETATLIAPNTTTPVATTPVAQPAGSGAGESGPATLVSTPAVDDTAEPDIAATLVAGTAPRRYASYPSPDGSLRAEVLIHDCTVVAERQANAYDILQVVEVASGEIHFIDGQLQYCGGLGAFGLAGLFWSPSGRFFYYSEAREGVPDGCGYWSRPVNRVDTSNWTTADLGGGPVSPDGLLLAVWDERELVVYEVDGGEVGRAASADALALGPIVWSPDSRSLAFVQAGMFCIPGESGMTTLVRVDLPSFASRVLLRSAEPAFQAATWDQEEFIRLEDDQGREWEFDLARGELSAATAEE